MQTAGKKINYGFIIIIIVNILFQKGPVTTSVPATDAEGQSDVSLFICPLKKRGNFFTKEKDNNLRRRNSKVYRAGLHLSTEYKCWQRMTLELACYAFCCKSTNIFLTQQVPALKAPNQNPLVIYSEKKFQANVPSSSSHLYLKW